MHFLSLSLLALFIFLVRITNSEIFIADLSSNKMHWPQEIPVIKLSTNVNSDSLTKAARLDKRITIDLSGNFGKTLKFLHTQRHILPSDHIYTFLTTNLRSNLTQDFRLKKFIRSVYVDESTETENVWIRKFPYSNEFTMAKPNVSGDGSCKSRPI